VAAGSAWSPACAPPGYTRQAAATIAGAALLVLLIATILAVYKPRGMTRYGRRKLHEQRPVLTR